MISGMEHLILDFTRAHGLDMTDLVRGQVAEAPNISYTMLPSLALQEV